MGLFKYRDVEFRPIPPSVYDELLVKYEQDHPKPSPPKVKYTPQTMPHRLASEASKLSKSKNIPIEEAEEIICRDSEPFDDFSDKEYKEQVVIWEHRRFVHIEDYILKNCTLFKLQGLNDPITMAEAEEMSLLSEVIQSDDMDRAMSVYRDVDERTAFFEEVLDNSILSWRLVLRMAKNIGTTRNGQPILEVTPLTASGEPQPMKSLLSSAAYDLSIPLFEIEKMPIKDQAMLLAQHLTRQWLQYWSYEDSRSKNNG